jgi:putative redox protein
MQTITAHIGKDHYQTTLTNSRHTITADENHEHDGDDLGPNPGELMLMSLASCTAITLRMYVDRKQWDVSEINITASSEKTENKTVFTCVATIIGNISEEEKDRLLNIAKVCPIHKVLTHPIEINTTLLLQN